MNASLHGECRSGRRLGRIVAWLAAAVAVPLLGGCGPDSGQVALCERVLREVVDPQDGIRIADRRTGESAANSVTLDFTVRQTNGLTVPRRLICRFEGARFAAGRLSLAAVWRDNRGPLSQLSLIFLKHRLHLK